MSSWGMPSVGKLTSNGGPITARTCSSVGGSYPQVAERVLQRSGDAGRRVRQRAVEVEQHVRHRLRETFGGTAHPESPADTSVQLRARASRRPKVVVGADGDEYLVGCDHHVGSGFVVKVPSAWRTARIRTPVCLRRSAAPQGDAGERRRVGNRELLHAELERAFVHDDIDELGDVRPGDERRHPGGAELLWVHHAVGAGVGELGHALVLAGAGDDEQVRHDGPGRQRHEEVLGVALQGRDECSGALESRGAQRRVEGGVADHGRDTGSR